MIVFQIHLMVSPERASDLDTLVRDRFVPAVQQQPGFHGVDFRLAYPDQPGNPPQLIADGFTHQIELRFEDEGQRAAWASSEEHREVWPLVRTLVDDVRGAGYDVLVSTDGAEA